MYTVRTRFYGRELAWLFAGLGVCAAGYYFSAPEFEVPVTGRKYRRLVPPELSTLVESTIAYLMVKYSDDEVLPPSHPYVREITSIGNVLTDANGLPRHEYIVINKEEANAFVVGGNIVFVYTGIAPMLANVSGTAMVLGHEMGHVIAGHSAEGLIQALTLMGIAVGMEMFGAGHQVVTQLWNILFQLPKKRQAELEADEIGYALMSKAGFDRREAVAVYERMMNSLGQQSQLPGDDFLQTHPVWPLRIALLNNLINTDTRPIEIVRLPYVMPISFEAGSLMDKVHNKLKNLEAGDNRVLIPTPETSPEASSVASSGSNFSLLTDLLQRYGLYAMLARAAGTRAQDVRARLAPKNTL